MKSDKLDIEVLIKVTVANGKVLIEQIDGDEVDAKDTHINNQYLKYYIESGKYDDLWDEEN